MNKKLLYTTLFTTLSLLFCNTQSIAQCNDTLIKKAIYESGSDAVFLKEYKVKFKKGKANRPAKVAKYSAFLKDSTTYRFNVVNAKEFDGKVILQLFRKGKLTGSTYNFKTLSYNNSFDFYCDKTDTYQVYMSFIEGEAGCAAGILSMIVNDSTVFKESNISEVLYLGIENPIFIAYTEEAGCSVQVISSQGIISGQNGKYTIIPDSVGTVKITAQTINSSNIIKEEISKTFKVAELPTPLISINGNTGGLILKSELINTKELSLIISNIPNAKPYKIIGFTISDKFSSISGKTSKSKYFTLMQIDFFRELKSGSKLFISNIKILRPDNKVIELKPIGYIIQ